MAHTNRLATFSFACQRKRLAIEYLSLEASGFLPGDVLPTYSLARRSEPFWQKLLNPFLIADVKNQISLHAARQVIHEPQPNRADLSLSAHTDYRLANGPTLIGKRCSFPRDDRQTRSSFVAIAFHVDVTVRAQDPPT